MNIIGQIDQSAFASGPRMHHGDDEPALEFPSSVSSRARGLLALRAINWRSNGGGEDPEETMYKEILQGLLSNTLPETVDIEVPDGVVRPYSFISNKCRVLKIRGCDYVQGVTQCPMYNAVGINSSIMELHYPDFTWLSYSPSVVNDFYGTDLFVPNVRRFGNINFSMYGFKGSHLNVHIEDTCDHVLAYQNFPGCESNKAKVSFVCTDGTLSWDGSAWVKS